MRLSLTQVTAATLLISPMLVLAETHRFSPTEYYNTFSAAHRPVLNIRAGDRVITRTVDAWGFDAQGRKVQGILRSCQANAPPGEGQDRAQSRETRFYQAMDMA